MKVMIKLYDKQVMTVSAIESISVEIVGRLNEKNEASTEILAELKKYCMEYLSYPLIQALSTEE